MNRFNFSLTILTNKTFCSIIHKLITIPFIAIFLLFLATNLSIISPILANSESKTETLTSRPPSENENNFVPPPLFYERIISFQSDIELHLDRSLTVTETIQVVALGNSIKRGIYRDFPTKYKTKLGFYREVDFTIISIKQDREEVAYRTERQPAGIRTYIGDKNIFLDKGIYTYEIKYRTTDQISFFENHDELFYNINGNDWEFSTEHISARIILPYEISPDSLAIDGYSGLAGAKNKDFTTVVKTHGGKTIIEYESTKVFSPYEGLTVLIEFPKNVFRQPSPQERSFNFLKSNIILILLFISTILVAIYYIMAWLIKGRDEGSSTSYPEFKPPDISPGFMRYLTKLGYDNKSFTSSLISLAVKGYLRINEEKTKGFFKRKEFSIIKTNNDTKEELTEDEKIIFDKFLATKDSFTFSQTYHATISSTINSYKKLLKQKGDPLIRKNISITIYAIIFTVIIYLASCLISVFKGDIDYIGISIFFLIWNGFTFAMAYLAIDSIFKQGGCSKIIFGFFWLIFIIPFAIAGISMSLEMDTSIYPFMGLLIQIFLHVIFRKMLTARTLEGRQLQNKIDGFKQFLIATEKPQIQTLSKDLPTGLELYEKYLPYAIALGVETQWSGKFKAEIEKAAQDSSAHQSNHIWFSGSSLSAYSASFGQSLSNSLGSSISSASVDPSSSSGGGGGGSSGGGGGGGGGGGW